MSHRRVKATVSIPDDMFHRAERLAKQRKVSRSQLYGAALVQMLDAEPKDELTRAYDSAFSDDAPDRFPTTQREPCSRTSSGLTSESRTDLVR